MRITLSAELAAIVEAWRTTGRYPSAEVAIREAIYLLQEHEQDDDQKLKELRREIDLGLQDAERGNFVDFDEKVLEEIKREARHLLS